MADTIREALERLLAVIKPKYTDPDEIVAVVRAMAAAHTALAAEPPAPAEPVAALHVSDFRGYENYDFQHLVDLPPGHYKLFTACTAQPPAPAPTADGERDHVLGAGNMVPAAYAARLRQCPTHGQQPPNAWGCPECLRELREELARLRAPAADGKREELARLLDDDGRYLVEVALARECQKTWELACRVIRAAALLREARPQPVPVAERPWERPGWCDAEGRCWFGAPVAGAADAGWILRKPSERLSHQTVSLPHWAIPQPPQGGGGGSVTEHRFQVEFGAMSAPIDEQLRDQDLRLDMEEAARWALQCDADGVARLFVRGILTEAEAHNAKNRILQIIKKQVRPLRPTQPTPTEPPTDD